MTTCFSPSLSCKWFVTIFTVYTLHSVPRDPVVSSKPKLRLDPPGTYITLSNTSPYLKFGTTGSLGPGIILKVVDGAPWMTMLLKPGSVKFSKCLQTCRRSQKSLQPTRFLTLQNILPSHHCLGDPAELVWHFYAFGDRSFNPYSERPSRQANQLRYAGAEENLDKLQTVWVPTLLETTCNHAQARLTHTSPAKQKQKHHPKTPCMDC